MQRTHQWLATGYTDASGIGFGGIVFRESNKIPPTVFRGQWPDDVCCRLVSLHNPSGSLSISDLEMGGLLILFLVMEAVCPTLLETNLALLSDNSPSVSWVNRFA